MKIIVIIPSRYGSSRFKGKPLEVIANKKPMIQCVYERVLKSNRIDDVYVATDDKRIFNIVTEFGGKAIMTSSTHASGTDRVAEAINYLDINQKDLVINVQGDQPLINYKCFDDLIDPLINNEQIQIVTLAFPVHKHSYVNNPKDVKVTFDFEGYALYFSRANIPHTRDINRSSLVYKHLGLYAYRKNFLKIFNKLPLGRLEEIEKLEQLRVIEHGHKIFVAITQYDSPEVDTPEDVHIINKKIEEFNNQM